MPGQKTLPTEQSVSEYLANVENDQRRTDATRLVALLREWTGEEPVMHGPSIIGFGHYHYRYESGHEGDSFLAGFAPRKNELVIYLMGIIEDQSDLLAKLGKHRMGKACLYVKKLENIDITVLEELVRKSMAALRAKYPSS